MYETWCEAHFIPKKLTVKMGNNDRQQSIIGFLGGICEEWVVAKLLCRVDALLLHVNFLLSICCGCWFIKIFVICLRET